MLASRHVGVMGVFPVLPDVFRLNLRLWDCLNRHFVSMVNTTAGPILEKLLQVPKRNFSASLAELYEHCSCHPRYPILFGISGTLHLPLPPDFTEMCKVLGAVGWHFTARSQWVEPEEDSAALERFLAEGEAPVYIGYGSMICRSGRYMTELSVRALMLAQRRGVLLGGFAEMSEQKVEDLELLAYCKEKVLFVESAAHAKLFPKCRVIVHHGGSGTTNACAKSGVPSVAAQLATREFLKRGSFGYFKGNERNPIRIFRSKPKMTTRGEAGQKVPMNQHAATEQRGGVRCPFWTRNMESGKKSERILFGSGCLECITEPHRTAGRHPYCNVGRILCGGVSQLSKLWTCPGFPK
ncbi:unnamed protein product [Effrenium voratum]|nr:unnamed protein product [Effrenium voratum]